MRYPVFANQFVNVLLWARLLGASGPWIQGPLTLSGLRGALCPQPLVV